MVWGDIVDCSSNCPAALQSASFLTQRKMKNEAALLVVPANARTTVLVLSR
jgi:hypothetical protein